MGSNGSGGAVGVLTDGALESAPLGEKKRPGQVFPAPVSWPAFGMRTVSAGQGDGGITIHCCELIGFDSNICKIDVLQCSTSKNSVTERRFSVELGLSEVRTMQLRSE